MSFKGLLILLLAVFAAVIYYQDNLGGLGRVKGTDTTDLVSVQAPAEAPLDPERSTKQWY